MKKINLVIIGIVSVIFLFLCFVYLIPSKIKENTTSNQVFPETINNINNDSQGKIVVKGIIKKEKIPQELELGDFWYWVYFDSPLYLENNASGEPSYVHKIEVYPPGTIQTAAFEAFLNKHVEIDGSWTGGYAESSVIQIDALKIIK